MASSASEAVATQRVLLYYKYVAIRDVDALIEWQSSLCHELSLTGRIRVSPEGINGTLGGTPKACQDYMQKMSEYCERLADDEEGTPSYLFQRIDWKASDYEGVPPFEDLLVQKVQEVVSSGRMASEDVTKGGRHLAPPEFHASLLQAAAAGGGSGGGGGESDVAIIDARNQYESCVGRFHGSLEPGTRNFAQFCDWVDDNVETLRRKKQVLMYCTGGVRCEKASAYVRRRCNGGDSSDYGGGRGGTDSHTGPDVAQLSGGIHRYLEAYPDGGGFFKGKNFVFDRRVTVPMPDNPSSVIAQCSECQTPCDTLRPHGPDPTVCAKCRDLVVLCDSCLESTDPSERFCQARVCVAFRTPAGLAREKAVLETALAGVSGRNGKSKRRTIRGQIEVIDKRMRVLESRAQEHIDNTATASANARASAAEVTATT